MVCLRNRGGEIHQGGRHDRKASTSRGPTKNTRATRDAWAIGDRFVELCSEDEKKVMKEVKGRVRK